MKINLKDLRNIADEKSYDVNIRKIEVNDDVYLRRLEDVEGYIVFFYDSMDDLKIEYHLEGKMICPCAITFEDVEVPFTVEDEDKVVFDQKAEGFYLDGDKELSELVLYIVYPEVPIKVVKKEKIEYSNGDGWSFVSEEEYEKSSKEKIDPRLEKLKDYHFDKED